jgi:hypothetical protein
MLQISVSSLNAAKYDPVVFFVIFSMSFFIGLAMALSRRWRRVGKGARYRNFLFVL